jgi:hypothetical protein
MRAKNRSFSAGTPPPLGATVASFVLFVSLASLLAMVYSLAEWWHLAGGFGFPSDGAWARAVFAHHVAAGEGLCFNPGIPAAGVAGASWIAAIAAVGFFTGKFLASAKLLGVVSVMLTAALAWYIALDLLGDWRFAFVAGLLVAGSPRLAAAGLSGTESAWAALLVSAAIYWQAMGWQGTPQQRAWGTAAVGLAALSRPELGLLVLALLIDRWLIALVHAPRDRAIRQALVYSLPETGAAALLLVPYIIYNWRAVGPLWQQPEHALRAQPVWGWAGAALAALWADNPVLLCAALLGVPMAVAAALSSESRHRSLFLVLIPTVTLAPVGVIWTHAAPSNATYMAAYLTPVVAVLAAAGLFLVHRIAARRVSSEESMSRRVGFAAGIAIVCTALLGFHALAHRPSWQQHGFRVKKVSDLQGYIGRWAGSHLAPDASIGSREVGAIGFFSGRRMVDLGGTISQQGLAYLGQPGSPDTNLLTFMEKVRPSHLAIRPSEFPDLSRRADLLTPAVTCAVSDPIAGGMTTMTLYETPWPPPSVAEARGLAER